MPSPSRCHWKGSDEGGRARRILLQDVSSGATRVAPRRLLGIDAVQRQDAAALIEAHLDGVDALRRHVARSMTSGAE
jgi:hypothetical protein